MDHTHSIMRVTTTTSPISGDGVRERMVVLPLQLAFHRPVDIIAKSWRRYRRRHAGELVSSLQARTIAFKAKEEKARVQCLQLEGCV